MNPSRRPDVVDLREVRPDPEGGSSDPRKYWAKLSG